MLSEFNYSNGLHQDSCGAQEQGMRTHDGQVNYSNTARRPGTTFLTDYRSNENLSKEI